MKKILAILLVSAITVVGSRAQIREETVELRSDDCSIQGSLMLPGGYDYKTVALLISKGSDTDRDGNEQIMRNNALRMVAVALANNGIASLRYDKRGVGSSRYTSYEPNRNNISAHANDVKNLANSLRRDKRFSKVVVVGHGEGSLLGMIAISRGAPASGFVSIDGVGRSFDQVLKDQLASTPIQMRDIAYEIIDTLKTGKTYQNVPVFLSSFFAPQLQPYLISSMKYNPQLLIRSLKIPVMVVHGDADIVVKVEDARLLAAANSSSRLVVIAGMNHVLKNCPSMERKDQIPTYANPALPISSTLITELVKFIDDL
ncbi:MAG: alpha/beta hydrolase [Mucinivorans sp.]